MTLKITALYPMDNLNYIAVLDDGSLVKLLGEVGKSKFKAFPVEIEDKRPEGPTMFDAKSA